MNQMEMVLNNSKQVEMILARMFFTRSARHRKCKVLLQLGIKRKLDMIGSQML